MKKIIYIAAVLLIATSFSYGQKRNKSKLTKPPAAQTAQPQTQPQPQTVPQTVPQTPQGSTKSTEAYGALVLRKVEVEAEYKEMLVDYTEEHPRVKIKKAEIDSLNFEMEKIAAMDSSFIPKLTATVGKLVLKKIDLQTEVNKLLLQYSEDHDLVKRAKQKVAVIEEEIQKVLQ
jgi:uncharacterized protein involved in exopolysaccharide biosynthesis